MLSVLAACAPASVLAAPGNAWHIPHSAEPGVTSMRDPVTPDPAAGLTLWSGNQYQGVGDPGNQLQTGSSVFAREIGAQNWVEYPLTFDHNSGNNVYYSVQIPSGTYAAGVNLEYYLQIPYSDHDTTFVYGSDGSSEVAIVEATAQADPFVVGVPASLQPSGTAELHAMGDIEAGWYPDSGHITVVGPDRSGGGTEEIVFAPARVQLDDEWLQMGPVTASTAIADGFELTQTLGNRQITARLTSTTEGVVRYEVVDWNGTAPTQTRIDAASDDQEHFYGFGEKFNTLDMAGRSTRIVTSDPAGNKGDLSYKTAPWFVSTRGYGFHLDSSAQAVFDMRASADDRYSITHEYGTLAYNIVYGPELTDVVSRYTEYTGRPALPPPWAFGPWMSTDHWRDGGEVRFVASRLVEEGIPGSVWVFDSPWETAYNDFTWNETQFTAGGSYGGQQWDGFASSQEMLEFLQSHGFKVVLWLTPFINTTSNDEGVPGQNLGQASNYAEAAAANYFVRDGMGGPPLEVDWWKGTGSPVDFTNSAARSWFRGQLDALVTDSGGIVGGFKIDDGEGAFVPDNAYYSDGRTGVLMKNGYTVEYHETVYDVLADDGILFSRSGFTGTQAYPGAWAGDNEPNFGEENGLPSVIVAGQTAAMSGWAIWGHDIGGYQDVNMSSTPENLFMRWAQFGALSPIMQMHRQVGAGMQYPWSFGEDGLDNYRFYTRLHTELHPYIYSHARIASETGVPIIRPLVLHYPDDPQVWAVQHTYLFGRYLLVAPMVTNQQTDRDVYLPEGAWYDYWSHERIDGGAVYTWSDADQSRLPLFVRRGALIPKLAEVPQTMLDAGYVGDPSITSPTDAWVVFAVPDDEPSDLPLYDGTQLSMERTPGALEITVDGAARPYAFEVLSEVPMLVTVGGTELPAVADAAALDAADSGWTTDGDLVLAKFDHAAGSEILRLVFDPSAGTDSGGASTGAATDATVGPLTDSGSGATNSDTGGTDSGSAGGDDSNGGCGCNTGRDTGVSFLFGGLVLFFMRRRTRTGGCDEREPRKANASR
jgi:alpha-D-xyloside xylohydrolase